MKFKDIQNILLEDGLLKQTQAVDKLVEIDGKVCTDNREVSKGDIFVCIKGFRQDGHNYISDARARGAALVVCEDSFKDAHASIRVKDSRKAAALIAKVYYQNPSSSFRLIGVTGTNGKTTSSLLIFKALRELGISAGWIGTLGYYINDREFSTGHTTPDIVELNSIFASMAGEGVQYVVMEVSSHALALDRVYGVEFDFCLFTNLSRDHLDFHHSMEEYGRTKQKLFEASIKHKAVSIINVDDSFGLQTYSELKAQDAFVFSVGRQQADYLVRDDHNTNKGSWEQTRFTITHSGGEIHIRSALIGKFNLENLALSAAAMSIMGFESRQIEQGINAVKPIRGRFERIPNERGIGVFIDYAHTPDAIDNVLRAARSLDHKRVLCLIGAGGERDKGKRPLMLNSALKHADAVVIADDNPRGENPENIIRDVIAGCELWLPWWIIRNRREAIRSIISLAQPGDIVLICGKGHETYQEICGVRHHFDDAEVAREALAESADDGYRNDAKLILPVDRLLLDILYGVPEDDSTGYIEPESYDYVSTDSRSIQSGSVFFALVGDNFDGHKFIPQVLQDDNNFAVGQVTLAGFPKKYIEASNTQSAMGDLFRKYLLMFNVYIIALTGSTGKTSTKELLANILNTRYPTLKTEANENNLIGLCKTLGRLKPWHRYAVLELGTNAFGEIAALSDVCMPDAAMILNVGPSHLQNLKDEEGVFREKSSLFDRSLDIRLYDADDNRFQIYKSKGKGVGRDESADFRITDIELSSFAGKFRLNGESYELPLAMPHMIKNSAFAIAMGSLAGIPHASIRNALQQPIRLDLRMQIEILEYCILIADCYNANPVSMQSAIEYWHRLAPDQEHVAILGDMLELGDQSATYHDMISTILQETGFDLLITVGDMAARYHGQDSATTGKHYPTVEDLITNESALEFKKGSVILVKGSHSIHLEKALPIIRNRC